jgi:glucose-fructose oxidoreductase
MTTAILRFPGDRLASFTTSFGAEAVSTYRLVGTDGQLVMDPAYQYATHLGYEVQIHGEKTRQRRFARRDQFGPELLYFSHCVQHGLHPEPDGAEGLADVRVVRAIYEAAATGRSIDLEPVPQARRPALDQEITRPGVDHPTEVRASGPRAD